MTITEKEIFYRNVDVGDREEIAVRAIKGYGTVVEITVDHPLGETTIRLSGGGALSLGNALVEAAEAVLRS